MRSSLLLLVCLPSCAAMVRTWSFQGGNAESDKCIVSVQEALVKQRTAFVTLRLESRSDKPQPLAVGTLALRLPDGTSVAGKTSFAGRAYHEARDRLASLGWGEREEAPTLAPDAPTEITVAFRAVRRDLRRAGVLVVDLAGISVAGAPLTGTIELRAPAEAPVGEEI